MKKGILILVAAIIIAGFVSCASTPKQEEEEIPKQDVTVKNMELASLKVHEGEYYLKQFRQFKNPPLPPTSTPPRRETYVPEGNTMTKGSGAGLIVAYEVTYNINEKPSEQDIDRAITSFEEALKLQPSGTWTLPQNHSGQITIRRGNSQTVTAYPPKEGIQASLENTRQIKQQWIAVDKPAMEELKAQQQFSVTLNNAGNGAIITGYTQPKTEPKTEQVSAFQRFREAQTDAVAKNDKIYLATISIPATIQDFPVKEIGDGAFRNNTTITNVVIPEGVTSIGSNAFSGCTSLTTVTFPSTITSIGAGAFSGCKALNVATQAALRQLGYTENF